MKSLVGFFVGAISIAIAFFVWSDQRQEKPSTTTSRYEAAPEATGAESLPYTKAALSDRKSALETITEAISSDTRKKRCFERAKPRVLKVLKAPRTALFADSLNDVQTKEGEVGTLLM